MMNKLSKEIKLIKQIVQHLCKDGHSSSQRSVNLCADLIH